LKIPSKKRPEKAQNVYLELLFHLVLTVARFNIYRVWKKQKCKPSQLWSYQGVNRWVIMVYKL